MRYPANDFLPNGIDWSIQSAFRLASNARWTCSALAKKPRHECTPVDALARERCFALYPLPGCPVTWGEILAAFFRISAAWNLEAGVEARRA